MKQGKQSNGYSGYVAEQLAPTTTESKTGEPRTGKPVVSLEWLAGVIEGDGSICAYGQKNRAPRARVCFYNSNWLLVEAVRQGFWQITGRWFPALERTKYAPQHHLRQWMVQVQLPRDVGEVCSALVPFLYGKREQARLAVRLCEKDVRRDKTIAHQIAEKIKHLNLHPPTPEETAETRRLGDAV